MLNINIIKTALVISCQLLLRLGVLEFLCISRQMGDTAFNLVQLYLTSAASSILIHPNPPRPRGTWIIIPVQCLHVSLALLSILSETLQGDPFAQTWKMRCMLCYDKENIESSDSQCTSSDNKDDDQGHSQDFRKAGAKCKAIERKSSKNRKPYTLIKPHTMSYSKWSLLRKEGLYSQPFYDPFQL